MATTIKDIEDYNNNSGTLGKELNVPEKKSFQLPKDLEIYDRGEWTRKILEKGIFEGRY